MDYFFLQYLQQKKEQKWLGFKKVPYLVREGILHPAPPGEGYGVMQKGQTEAKCLSVTITQQSSCSCTYVLVSAGTELTLFLVAGTVLCFGFSVRMMLITFRCFSCC